MISGWRAALCLALDEPETVGSCLVGGAGLLSGVVALINPPGVLGFAVISATAVVSLVLFLLGAGLLWGRS